MKINDIVNRNIAEDTASDIASIQKAIADLQKQAASNPAMKASSDNAIAQLQGQLANLQKQPQAAQSAPAAPAAAEPTTAAKGGGVFPTSKAEIKAWQEKNNLRPDGLIGDKTYAAMSAAGMKAPPGFQKVPNKPKAPKPAEPAADSTAAPNNDSSSYTGTTTPVTPPAAAGDQTAGGKTNADFLPGAAGGAQDIARLQQTAGVRPGGVAFNQDALPGANQGQTTTVRPGGVAFNQDAPPGEPAQAAQAAPAAAAPSALPNPWDGKDPAKAAAWSALSPEDQKWLGNADPTDKFILARSPSKGGFLGSVTPNFMKKKQPDAAQAAQAAPPAPGGTKGPQTTGGYGRFNEDDDLTAMLRIAGLK